MKALKKVFLLMSFIASFSACAQENTSKEGKHIYKVSKSEADWKAQLSSLEYEVLREEGTEQAFSGKYLDWKKVGTFTCNACKHPVFSSKTKFKSGTGWPSFYAPLNERALIEKKDTKYGWNRIEIECAACGSHLGHVFNDGPKPTGLRYCINSVALDFIEE